MVPLLSLPQRPVPLYKQQLQGSNVIGSVRMESIDDAATLAEESLEPKYHAWRKNKILLPLAFAASAVHRPAVTALLLKMQQTVVATKRRTFGATTTSVIQRPTNASTSSLASSIRKCAFSLLVQQDTELTIMLLKSGFVQHEQRDPKDATPLHLAVRAGNADLIKVLLHFDDGDASLLNAQGENGWTALHEAMSRKHLGIFRMLLKRGANATISNNYGDTARALGQKLGVDSSDIDQIWFGASHLIVY
jgi:hypothetical protein